MHQSLYVQDPGQQDTSYTFQTVKLEPPSETLPFDWIDDIEQNLHYYFPELNNYENKPNFQNNTPSFSRVQSYASFEGNAQGVSRNIQSNFQSYSNQNLPTSYANTINQNFRDPSYNIKPRAQASGAYALSNDFYVKQNVQASRVDAKKSYDFDFASSSRIVYGINSSAQTSSVDAKSNNFDLLHDINSSAQASRVEAKSNNFDLLYDINSSAHTSRAGVQSNDFNSMYEINQNIKDLPPPTWQNIQPTVRNNKANVCQSTASRQNIVHLKIPNLKPRLQNPRPVATQNIKDIPDIQPNIQVHASNSKRRGRVAVPENNMNAHNSMPALIQNFQEISVMKQNAKEIAPASIQNDHQRNYHNLQPAIGQNPDDIPDIKPNIEELQRAAAAGRSTQVTLPDISPTIQDLFASKDLPQEFELELDDIQVDEKVDFYLNGFLDSAARDGTDFKPGDDLLLNYFESDMHFDWSMLDQQLQDGTCTLIPGLEEELVEEKTLVIHVEDPQSDLPKTPPSPPIPPKEEEEEEEEEEEHQAPPEDPSTSYSFREKRPSKHKFRPFACCECSYTTSRFNKLEKHVKKQHPTDDYGADQLDDDVDYCPTSIPPRRRSKRKSSSTKSKSLKCSQCSYQTPRSDRLKKHMEKIHSKNVCYACNVCQFQSTYNRDYYDHMRKHYKGPPFQCLECGYTSKLITAFIAHRVNHTGDRLFRCTLCMFSCKRKYHLKGHMVSHTKDKNFVCVYCFKRYSYKCSLVRHFKMSCTKKPCQAG